MEEIKLTPRTDSNTDSENTLFSEMSDVPGAFPTVSDQGSLFEIEIQSDILSHRKSGPLFQTYSG